MKKIFIKYIAFVCIFCSILCVCGCDREKTPGNATEGKIFHTVKFNTYGGSPINDLKVEHGSLAVPVDNPTRENYIFLQWESKGKHWMFSYYVEEDMVLNAAWVKAEDMFGISPFEDGLSVGSVKRQEELDSLAIPEVINGKKVLAIGDEAFSGPVNGIHKRYAKELIIPQSVKYIGNNAFKGISEVNIVINSEIYHLGESAFEDCKSISKIILGVGLKEIPYSAFAGCTGISQIALPDGLETICESAFDGAGSLENIILPESLNIIEDDAFNKCTSLKTVFYKGTFEEFTNIEISRNNEAMENAKVYFYSETAPQGTGEFWHYDVSGNPILW